MNFSLDIYTYNANGQETSDSEHTVELTRYTYDTSGHLTNQLWQFWNGSQWVNNRQLIFTYDVNGNETTLLYHTWNVIANRWTNSIIDTFIHLMGTDHETSLLYQNWIGGAWVNDHEYIYTYDAKEVRLAISIR